MQRTSGYGHGLDETPDAACVAPAPFAALRLNVAQQSDALVLLRLLPDGYAPLVFFDPQHRAIMDKKKYGNEGERQRGRAKLPAMSEDYIDACCIESARILKPSGYLMRWMDKFCLCEGHHLRISQQLLERVDLIAWDNLRPGQETVVVTAAIICWPCRSRRRGRARRGETAGFGAVGSRRLT